MNSKSHKIYYKHIKHKSIYGSNEHVDTEIKNVIPFIISKK